MVNPVLNLRTILFVAEGGHGIAAHGAPRGDISGETGHSSERKCNGGERGRIVGRDVEEQVADEMRSRERAWEPDG